MSPVVATPRVDSFFHAPTNTFTYVVSEPAGKAAAIIDPVLDYDAASACTSTRSADAVLVHLRERGLQVQWILETHAHADHLSAGGYLRDVLGAPLAIGQGIVQVQARFQTLLGLKDDEIGQNHLFDRLLSAGECLPLGALQVRVLATPGHTDDSLTYVIGDAAFIGDTLFAPETGTARVDFPGGSARKLYASIQTIFELPPDTRIFLCHDYPTDRPPHAQSSVTAQRRDNIHVGNQRSEAAFIALREARDASLPVPRLILPALQVNLRAGRLPKPDSNGIAYLRIPLNQLGHDA